MGTFVQGSFSRQTWRFVGLPIIYSLPDTPAGGRAFFGADGGGHHGSAPMMVFYNIGGVVVLILSQHPPPLGG